jgi:hypothetical protein
VRLRGWHGAQWFTVKEREVGRQVQGEGEGVNGSLQECIRGAEMVQL